MVIRRNRRDNICEAVSTQILAAPLTAKPGKETLPVTIPVYWASNHPAIPPPARTPGNQADR